MNGNDLLNYANNEIMAKVDSVDKRSYICDDESFS